MTDDLPRKVQVWWPTDTPGELAHVLESRPYGGKYKDVFTHDLKVEAQRTKKGWLWLSWDNRSPCNPAQALYES